MRDALLAYVAAVRRAGVVVSTAATLDALAAAEAVGYDDRATLRDAFAAALATSPESDARVRETFDRFFVRERADDGAGADARPPARGADSELARLLLANDPALLDVAIEAAAEAAETAAIRSFTQLGAFLRAMLDALGGAGLLADVARLRASGDADDAELAADLADRERALRDRVRARIGRDLMLANGGRSRAPALLPDQELALLARDPRERDRLRLAVRALARKLASRYGRRRRAVRGPLDAVRTVRASIRTDGVPFDPAYRKRRRDRPKIVVLCDVSGSVAANVEFVLTFLVELRGVLASLRAFAFTHRTLDVTRLVDRDDALDAILRVSGYRSSSYGGSFADFVRRHERAIDRRTTVIVLGDARGNYTEPRVDLVARIAARSRGIVWLNPEPRAHWGTGDSDMDRYLPYCRVDAVVRTVADLERAVGAMMRDALA